MKERKKLKEVYLQHKNIISLIFVIALFTVLFTGGNVVSWKFIDKPLNDSQFQLCEQVARDVYAQTRNALLEVPEDFSVKITETTITVEVDNSTYKGQIIAKLQNSKLLMTRDMETTITVELDTYRGRIIAKMRNGELVITRNRATEDAVYSGICIGIIFLLVPIAIALAVYLIVFIRDAIKSKKFRK